MSINHLEGLEEVIYRRSKKLEKKHMFHTKFKRVDVSPFSLGNGVYT